MSIKGIENCNYEELKEIVNGNDSGDAILEEIEKKSLTKKDVEKKVKSKTNSSFSDTSSTILPSKKKSLGYYAKKAGAAPVKNALKQKLLSEYGLTGADATEDAYLVTAILQTAQQGNIQALNAYREITKDDMLDEIEYSPFYLPANLIASSFVDINREIDKGEIKEAVFIGGRGSTKSTYISEKIIELLKNRPTSHAVIFRQVKDTLKNSVFAQMLWSIDKLGLTKEFKSTKNPLEITYLPTGQKILFLGGDEKAKIKGIKLPFGQIDILWFEEFDQFNSEEDIRSINQSGIRGTDKSIRFYSSNPPKSSRAWSNKFILKYENIKSGFRVHRSDYRSVPKEWLGTDFIMEAELQKKLNEKVYQHEYLGEVTGAGDNVFDNIYDERITDEMIANFPNHYYGADFGFKDATAWNAMSYDSDTKTLYIYDEFHKTHMPDPSDLLVFLAERKFSKNDLITADSHDIDKITFMRNYGYTVMGAHKIKNVKMYGYNFLVGLNKIVIDKERAPYTYKEFYEYHHNLNRDGDIINTYPEGQEDHHMSSVIYALERVWKRLNAWRGTNQYEEYIDSL